MVGRVLSRTRTSKPSMMPGTRTKFATVGTRKIVLRIIAATRLKGRSKAAETQTSVIISFSGDGSRIAIKAAARKHAPKVMFRVPLNAVRPDGRKQLGSSVPMWVQNTGAAIRQLIERQP
jgi:hypothetical protein